MTHLYERATVLHNINGSLDRDLGTAGIHHQVDRAGAALRDVELLAYRFRIALGVLDLSLALHELRREVDIGSSVVLSEIQTALKDVSLS